jgi:ABC-2 type transport system ATP-binding protein
MKQRLGIATALLGEPELLVLDEPTNGLDPAGILEIRELIRRMPREYGMTVLVSSHLLSEIEQTATQVGIIASGKLIYQDSIESLRRKSQSSISILVDDPAKALTALADPNFGAERTEGGVRFRLTSNEAVAAAVERLVAADVSVYRVEESKTSLEDIFLELTGTEGSL